MTTDEALDRLAKSGAVIDEMTLYPRWDGWFAKLTVHGNGVHWGYGGTVAEAIMGAVDEMAKGTEK